MTASRLPNTDSTTEAHNQSPPVALTITRSNQEFIARCSPAAEALGIRPGMPVAFARAVAQEVQTAPWNPQQEFRELYRLALWARRFSPLTGVDDALLHAARSNTLASTEPRSWGLVLETTGTERVHGGEVRLTQRVYRALQRAGIEAQLAIAPTIGMAWGLSRFAEHRITVSERLELPQLFPLRALRLPHEILTGLAQLGVHTVGQLLQIPRQTLGVRFGKLILRRLDEIQGAIPEPFHIITPRARFRVAQVYDAGIVSREQLAVGIEAVVEQLLTQLRNAHRELLRCTLHLRGYTEQGLHTIVTKRLALHSATNNTKALMRLWGVALERVALPPRIERIALEATQTQAPNRFQLDALDRTGGCCAGIEELLNTFVVSLGEDAVQQAEIVESYLPEESFRFTPLQQQKKEAKQTSPEHLIPQRPPVLFPTPQLMRTFAMLPDSPPTWFEWRGKRHQVRHSCGPERITTSWAATSLATSEGQDAAATREYFRLEDESGRWLWVYRERESLRWYVHGVWA